MTSISENYNQLPPEIMVKVKIYINSLMEKRQNQPLRPLKQDWAGGFCEYKSQFTSLELQKKAMDWRGD